MMKTAIPIRTLSSGFEGLPRNGSRETRRIAAIDTANRTHAGIGIICWIASMAINVRNGRTQGTAAWRRKGEL
jgi:hypothetical protein